jgi:outer membrane lipoprotein-sorting protein
MPWTSKAIATLATAASLLVVYLGLSSLTGSALAFADVVEVLNKVRSATWKTTLEAKGLQNETVKWSEIGMFLAPSHERMETTAEGQKSIRIADGEKDKTIVLNTATKTAIVIDLKNLPPEMESPLGKTFLGLRELVAQAQSGTARKVERLGLETIDGRPAEGFRIQLGSVEVKIWADPKTLLPIRVEEKTAAGPEAHLVMTDFQVGVDLDESLFSLDVPPGYTIQQSMQLDLSKTPWAYLADALKMAAEYNDGVFPPTLRGEKGIDGILQRAAKSLAEERGKESPEKKMASILEFSMKYAAALGALNAVPPDAWQYAGKDVKLNTPNRPVLWIKQKKGGQCVVIYANLSIKEVPSEEAPTVPQSEETPKQ